MLYEKIKQDLQCIGQAYIDNFFSDQLIDILKTDMQQLYLEKNKDKFIGETWKQFKEVFNEFKQGEFSSMKFARFGKIKTDFFNYMEKGVVEQPVEEKPLETSADIVFEISKERNKGFSAKPPNPYIGTDESVVENNDLRELYKISCRLIDKFGSNNIVTDLKTLVDKLLKENSVKITTKVGDNNEQ